MARHATTARPVLTTISVPMETAPVRIAAATTLARHPATRIARHARLTAAAASAMTVWMANVSGVVGMGRATRRAKRTATTVVRIVAAMSVNGASAEPVRHRAEMARARQSVMKIVIRALMTAAAILAGGA